MKLHFVKRSIKQKGLFYCYHLLLFILFLKYYLFNVQILLIYAAICVCSSNQRQIKKIV